MKSIPLTFILLALLCVSASAQDSINSTTFTTGEDPACVPTEKEDSIAAPPCRRDKMKQKYNIFKRFIRAFDEYDTTYITPNRYNWAFMLQNTNSFELYDLTSRKPEQSLDFASRPSIKFGPYIGWRWIFLGYTFDVTSYKHGQESRRTEFDLSLYSSMLGCDLIYRRTGDNFRIKKTYGFGPEAERVEGHPYNGIRINVTGVNVYYVFNHNHFSYPAAFAQSTVQRKSCGTWQAGFSCTRHEMSFDYDELPREITSSPEYPLKQEFMFDKIDYMDYSIRFGYAYNWVFKHNWLFSVSLEPALGYKKTRAYSSNINTDTDEQKSMALGNVHFNGILRAGLVWNNTKYFGGLSIIMRNYNYRRDQMTISNTFGTVNLYWGLNFKKKKNM
ncbi:MAG: DUF4421 domain-containing protein [Clostridium sp.]|nr:DUF4421 domain-containing protein [Clostridium sp.]